jgi:hypothetical protein
VVAQEWFDKLTRLFLLFYDSKLEACRESVFQEQRAAKAFELALDHDPNTVTKNISFVHIVCRQKYDLISSIIAEHIPK